MAVDFDNFDFNGGQPGAGYGAGWGGSAAGGPGAPYPGGNAMGGFGGGYVPTPPMHKQPPKFHVSMFLFALLGGLVGTVLSTILYMLGHGGWSNILLVGSICGVMTLCILMACALCEAIKPRLNAQSRSGSGRQFLIALLAAVVLFGVGCGLEFLYELGAAAKMVSFDDYIFVIDDSGSMESTDPDDMRYEALSQLLDTFDSSKGVGLIRFDDQLEAEGDLAPYDQAQADRISDLLAQPKGGGGTDFTSALTAAYEMYQRSAQAGRNCLVVLLSDGQSSVSSQIMADYGKANLTLSTVGLGRGTDRRTLTQIAEETGGAYYEVEDASDLVSTFSQVQTVRTSRCLLTSRVARERTNPLWMILRVVFLAIPGVLLAVAFNMMFTQNTCLRQIPISAGTGLLSGLVMELGTLFTLPLTAVHAVSWMLYAIILVSYVPVILSGRDRIQNIPMGMDPNGNWMNPAGNFGGDQFGTGATPAGGAGDLHGGWQ